MLWIIEKILFSLIFIMSVHHLLIYFQTNLTVPKQKDMFYEPMKNYTKMYEIIKQKKDDDKDDGKEKMKNELKAYLQNNLK